MEENTDAVRALGVPETLSTVKKTVKSGKHDVTTRSGVATRGVISYHDHARNEALKGTVLALSELETLATPGAAIIENTE